MLRRHSRLRSSSKISKITFPPVVLSGLRKINTTSYLREPPGHTKGKAAQVSEGTVAVTVNDPTRTCLQRGVGGGT